MKFTATRVRGGELNCVQVDAGGPINTLVVALHGYGAPGDDLVAFAEYWINQLGEAGKAVRYVFPEAPISLTEMGIPGGRAWWPLNMDRLMQAVQARDFEELRAHEPPGIDTARKAVVSLIQAQLEELQLPTDRLVLGGFSQGAMLSTDITMRGLSQPPGGLFLFSGTLVCEPFWREHATRVAGLPIVQSHGTADPILPFDIAEALRDLLVEAGAKLQFHSFPGGHSTCMEAMDSLAARIREMKPDPTPRSDS